MTGPAAPWPVRTVRCPTCADLIGWSERGVDLYHFDRADEPHPVRTATMDPTKLADARARGYRRCPNPSGDTVEHYLPATYADYGEPLVVGLVGASYSGKTHLLTAMIRQALGGPELRFHGLTATSLDQRKHEAFTNNFIHPFETGVPLAGTGAQVVESAEILLLTRQRDGYRRPVVFFDVAGGDLVNTDAVNRGLRFMAAANAVIFVRASEDALDVTGADSSQNRSFDQALARLRTRPDGQPVAAIAVTKADRLRYVPPADRWMRRGSERSVDAARIWAESRDVYSYLHHTGAGTSLAPYDELRRCTLHFVSASGGDAVTANPDDPDSAGRYFPRSIRPMRVVEPLVSILAMAGMIPGPEAEKVGMP